MARVTIERVDGRGGVDWFRIRLSLDPVADTIEIQLRGFLGRRKPSLMFRAGEITGFDVVMVGDPLAHLYASNLLIALPAVFYVFGWASDNFGWEIGSLALKLAAIGLAFVLANWIRIPAIRLEQPHSQPSSPSQDSGLELASLKGRDPKAITSFPTFRRTLAEGLVKAIARQPSKVIRGTLSILSKDPTMALDQLTDMGDSLDSDWVHIVSTWSGVLGTRSLALRITDILALHRYRGMLPDTADDLGWRAVRLRRLLAAGLVMAISLSAAIAMIVRLAK